MGRPPLPIGTHGKVSVKAEVSGQFRARCRYRHFDGKVYEVERYGTSEAQAVRRLKEAVRDFVTPAAADNVGPQSKLAVVAAAWLAELERLAGRDIGSWGTIDTYRSRLQTLVLPRLGELRMRELTAKALDNTCQDVRDEMSASSAKTVRAILSGICAYGVKHGALDRNLSRDIGRLDSKQARHQPAKSRALTPGEVVGLLGKLDADEQAIRDDLPDLVRFFLATGERTGEALGADWEDFDQDKKLIRMEGNVIRATGHGRVINRGKTPNSERPIPLADWCVSMLVKRQRLTGRTTGPIFPSTTGTIREASNVRNRAWKPFTERAGFEWVVFRTFRKTVATMLDEAKLSARQIADLLGHARPSMTQDVYMGRGAVSRDAADALGTAFGEARGKRGE